MAERNTASPPPKGMSQEQWESFSPQKRAAITRAARAKEARESGTPQRPKGGNSTKRVVHRRKHGDSVVRIGRQATDLLIDPASIEDWDDEEIRRGQRKAADGSFRGRPPKVVPHEVYQELVKRTLNEANESMRQHLPMVISELVAIVSSPAAEDRDRLKAMEMVLNRVMGKEPQKVEVKQGEKPWEVALNVSIVDSVDDDDDASADGTDGDDE